MSQTPARNTRSKRNLENVSFEQLEEDNIGSKRPPRVARKNEKQDDDDIVNEEEDEVDEALEQRERQNASSITDDLICPISMELPFDPVTADDGRVYERSAIEQHFETIKNKPNGNQHHHYEIKSPMTNQVMGEKLLPAPQIKNHIQALIDGGVISNDDLIESWNNKVKEEKDKEKLLRDAEDGNVGAMSKLARNFNRGLNGFKQDSKLGFSWSQRAHDAGDVKATARLGHCFLNGDGIPKNKSKGIMLTTMAAMKGSDVAAFRLGMALADGKHGLPQDSAEAIKWLKACLSESCSIQHLSTDAMHKAKEKIADLEGNQTD